jgi:hypothetical protein
MKIDVTAARWSSGKVVAVEPAQIIDKAGDDSVLVEFRDGKKQGCFPSDMDAGVNKALVLALCGQGGLFELGARLSFPGLGALMVEQEGRSNYGIVNRVQGRYRWSVLSGARDESGTAVDAVLRAVQAIGEADE